MPRSIRLIVPLFIIICTKRLSFVSLFRPVEVTGILIAKILLGGAYEVMRIVFGNVD